MRHALDLQRALIARLSDDPGLAAALGGSKVFDAVPHAAKGVAPPWLSVGDEAIEAAGAADAPAWRHRLVLSLFSDARGSAEIKGAMAALAAALDAPLAVDGARVADLRLEKASVARKGRWRRADCTWLALLEAAPAPG